jgi:hypothetical protein
VPANLTKPAISQGKAKKNGSGLGPLVGQVKFSTAAAPPRLWPLRAGYEFLIVTRRPAHLSPSAITYYLHPPLSLSPTPRVIINAANKSC